MNTIGDFMITLRGQYELAEFQAAQKLHARGVVRRLWLLAIIFAALPVFTLLNGVTLSWFSWLAFLPSLAIIIGLAVGQRFLLRRQAARAFSQQKDLSAPFTIELTEEKFNMENEFGSSHIPWEDFVKWTSNDEFILLYRSNMVFHLLPRRLFGDQSEVDYVIKQLRESDVPGRVLG